MFLPITKYRRKYLLYFFLPALVVLFAFTQLFLEFEVSDNTSKPCIVYDRSFGSMENTFTPTFICYKGLEERVGSDVVGNGDGKWVCNPNLLYSNQTSPCLVYSIGGTIKKNWDFENAILHRHNPSCQIHAFDLTPHSNQPASVFFHSIRLWNETDALSSIYSLVDIIKMLHHENMIIKSLKVDCGGCEFHSVWDSIAKARQVSNIDVEQLHIKVHYMASTDWETHFFKKADEMGFDIFHKEHNLQECPCDMPCVEFSFINRKFSHGKGYRLLMDVYK